MTRKEREREKELGRCESLSADLLFFSSFTSWWWRDSMRRGWTSMSFFTCFLNMNDDRWDCEEQRLSPCAPIVRSTSHQSSLFVSWISSVARYQQCLSHFPHGHCLDMSVSSRMLTPLLDSTDESQCHRHCCFHCFHLRSTRACRALLIDFVYSIPRRQSHQSSREPVSSTYVFVFPMPTTDRNAIAWFVGVCWGTSISLKLNASIERWLTDRAEMGYLWGHGPCAFLCRC